MSSCILLGTGHQNQGAVHKNQGRLVTGHWSVESLCQVVYLIRHIGLEILVHPDKETVKPCIYPEGNLGRSYLQKNKCKTTVMLLSGLKP